VKRKVLPQEEASSYRWGMKHFLLSLSLLISSMSISQVAAADAAKFCELRKNPEDIRFSLYNPENRISFANDNGDWNLGLCWWMARFQRNLTQLIIFEGGSKHYTDCPLLKINQIENVFARLRDHQVTRVGCYNNAQDFTKAHKNQLLRLLSDWQKHDTYFLQFLKGLKGSSEMNPVTVANKMEQIYDQVERQNQIAYVMLQMPGAAAHAWLVIAAEKQKTQMMMDVVDSNYPKNILRVRYTYGSRDMSFPRDLVEKLGPGKPSELDILSKGGDPYAQFTLHPMFIAEGKDVERRSFRACGK
jgi:hypothetical protein